MDLDLPFQGRGMTDDLFLGDEALRRLHAHTQSLNDFFIETLRTLGRATPRRACRIFSMGIRELRDVLELSDESLNRLAKARVPLFRATVRLPGGLQLDLAKHVTSHASAQRGDLRVAPSDNPREAVRWQLAEAYCATIQAIATRDVNQACVGYRLTRDDAMALRDMPLTELKNRLAAVSPRYSTNIALVDAADTPSHLTRYAARYLAAIAA